MLFVHRPGNMTDTVWIYSTVVCFKIFWSDWYFDSLREVQFQLKLRYMCQIIVRTHKAQEKTHFRHTTNPLKHELMKPSESFAPKWRHSIRFPGSETSRARFSCFASLALRALPRARSARFLFLPDWARPLASLVF